MPVPAVRRLLLSLATLVLLSAAARELWAHTDTYQTAATSACADQRPADNGTRDLIVVFQVLV